MSLGGKAEVYDTELTGLVVGIRTAISKAESLPRVHHIHIFADNVSAIKTVSDPKPCQGQLLAYTFYQHMLQWLQKNPVNTLRVAWCPGHADIPGNERADQLAKEATLLPSSAEPTITHNTRHARECLKRDWTTLWRNSSPQQGSWATANRIPPSLHPTPHFLALADKRELFGRLLQCRTGHSYSGEYYRRFFPSADPACPCGEPTQTREHVIQSCPTYEKHRTALRKVSQTLYLPDLLGTKDGIEAITSFLENSGAFTKNGQSPPSLSTPHMTDRPLTDFIETEPQAPS